MSEQKKSDTQELAELRAIVEKQQTQITALLKINDAQGPILTPLAKEKEREEYLERRQKELTVSVEERSQAEAERRWGKETKTRFPVQLTGVPLIKVPANTTHEADGRYRDLCGIRSFDPEHAKLTIGTPITV